VYQDKLYPDKLYLDTLVRHTARHSSIVAISRHVKAGKDVICDLLEIRPHSSHFQHLAVMCSHDMTIFDNRASRYVFALVMKSAGIP
jgi:hypothetical protein